jgi:hypothetical protein
VTTLSLVSLLGRCAAWCIGTALHVFSTAGRVAPVKLHSHCCPVTTSTRLFLSEALVTRTRKFRIPEHIHRPHPAPSSPTPRQLPVGSTAPTQPVCEDGQGACDHPTRCGHPAPPMRRLASPFLKARALSAMTFCGDTCTHLSRANFMHALHGATMHAATRGNLAHPPHSSRQSILCQTPWALADSFSRNPPTACCSPPPPSLASIAPPCNLHSETIVRIPSQRAPTTVAPSQGCTAAPGARARRTAQLRVRKCTGSREATSKPARR